MTFKTVQNTDLMIAALEGRLEGVRIALAAGADINHRNSHGETSLMGAIVKGQHEVAEFLISNGADLNITDNDGWSALKAAVILKDEWMVRLLLHSGASTDNSDKSGMTLLMFAALSSINITEELLKHGIDMFSRDSIGFSALDHAVAGERWGTVDLLLRYGAEESEFSKMKDMQRKVDDAFDEMEP